LKLRLIDGIQPRPVWSVDGKRIDPSKPYDRSTRIRPTSSRRRAD
jgi:hypothetical protein